MSGPEIECCPLGQPKTLLWTSFLYPPKNKTIFSSALITHQSFINGDEFVATQQCLHSLDSHPPIATFNFHEVWSFSPPMLHRGIVVSCTVLCVCVCYPLPVLRTICRSERCRVVKGHTVNRQLSVITSNLILNLEGEEGRVKDKKTEKSHIGRLNQLKCLGLKNNAIDILYYFYKSHEDKK